ncbi:hypothetical protein HL658_24355 [Azospirillum sp. RWY-5-1]|uniref:DUF1049 domain-containing protein n=1 Tax=Azospirillum oleiclasticum TaxID=2735135 RepID=A0ABX2TC82_9PROT|nr:hypothetical protein [Azospirillum oleiclasticum]NYZ15686.1 hypothetical protein [Azospirillum oleiclasticum]NYZ21956.1 hypothetical protein [Azospirillum oleiclasticum]
MARGRSHRRRIGVIGWLGFAGAGLAAIGLAGTILVLLVPVERLDAEGRVIGEMPPAFTVGLLMLVAGLAVLTAAMLAAVLRRARRRWTRLGS